MRWYAPFFTLLLFCPAVPAWCDDAEVCKTAVEANDNATAFIACTNAATQGNPDSQNKLGNLYFSGLGVSKDLNIAEFWYQKALIQRNVKAAYNLGLLYSTLKKPAVAFKYFQKSADQNFPSGVFQVGYSYIEGVGVSKDIPKGLSLVRKAADDGEAMAQGYQGRLYHYGEHVKKDYAEALKWYLKAAEQGNAYSQVQAGLMYEFGNGVEKDIPRALELLHKSADQNFPEAMIAIGTIYSGDGLENFEETARWYKKAADLNSSFGQYLLGNLFETGKGVNQDYAEALRLYRLSAEQGDSSAQDALGSLYSTGRGVEKNNAEAYKWYKKAADQGHSNGLRNLGVMYENGWGVRSDCLEAIRLYQKASEKETNPLKDKYVEEYLNSNDENLVYLRSLVANAQSHKEVINNLKKIAKKKVNTITVNNMRINYILYKHLDYPIDKLTSLLESSSENDKSSSSYALILAQKNMLGRIQNQIYEYSQGVEQKSLNKNNGIVFKASNRPLLWLLNDTGWRPAWKPEPGYYYSLDGMVSMQTADGGVLLTGAIPGGKNVFLYTNQNFVDSESLAGHFATFAGYYKYQSLLGMKNVYAFKLFTPNFRQVLNGKQFYFYPELANLELNASIKSVIFGK